MGLAWVKNNCMQNFDGKKYIENNNLKDLKGDGRQ
jgi:hypothetical protein